MYAQESSLTEHNMDLPVEAKYVAYGMAGNWKSEARIQSTKLRQELENKLNSFGKDSKPIRV